jgi:hypothetical protein
VALDWTLVASRCPQAIDLDLIEQLGLEQVVAAWCPAAAPELAQVYLARHLVLLQDLAVRGVLGPVTSESLGPSSTSTGAPGIDLPPDHWGATSWGVAYLELVAEIGMEVI